MIVNDLTIVSFGAILRALPRAGSQLRVVLRHCKMSASHVTVLALIFFTEYVTVTGSPGLGAEGLKVIGETNWRSYDIKSPPRVEPNQLRKYV